MKIAILGGCFFLFLGCKKEVGTAPDKTAPVISFAAPNNNQLFTGDQSVDINATITDESKIREIHLEILNKTTNTLYTHEHFVPDGNSYHLASSFVIPSAAGFEIKVEAQDSSGNNAEAIVNVSAN